jgi:poly [ADP-ribose] polymerase 6/8
VTSNKISDAEDLLMTGATSFSPPRISYTYDECPLIWLILEICDAFFDLTDHCCVCGADLGVAGVKLSLCSNPLCLFAFRDIGVGSNLVGELARDPAAADLLLSLASVSESPFFYAPAGSATSADLPVSLLSKYPNFWETLPSVSQMVSMETDANLSRLIGAEKCEILQKILLTVRTHLISLPEKLKLPQCANETDQFLVVVSSPERELTFRQKKARHGAHYLWHGSPASCWLSILQNGLGLAARGKVWHATLSTISFIQGFGKRRRDSEQIRGE